MTAAAAAEPWPPTSYRRLRSLMDRGQGRRAPGPCALAGCTLAVPDPRPLAPPFVWDHCHAHDYVRGMLCRVHNVAMGPVDRQDHAGLRWWGAWLERRGGLALGELLAYWERCPECAAAGPWQPVMVRHSPGIVQRSREHGAVRERIAAARERSGPAEVNLPDPVR